MRTYTKKDERMIVRGRGKHRGRYGVIEAVNPPAPLGLYQRIEVAWMDGVTRTAFRDEIQPLTLHETSGP